MTLSEKPARRRGPWWQKMIAGVSLTGALTGGAAGITALRQSARADGEKVEVVRQLRRDIDVLRLDVERLRDQHLKLVWTMTRGGTP